MSLPTQTGSRQVFSDEGPSQDLSRKNRIHTFILVHAIKFNILYLHGNICPLFYFLTPPPIIRGLIIIFLHYICCCEKVARKHEAKQPCIQYYLQKMKMKCTVFIHLMKFFSCVIYFSFDRGLMMMLVFMIKLYGIDYIAILCVICYHIPNINKSVVTSYTLLCSSLCAREKYYF